MYHCATLYYWQDNYVIYLKCMFIKHLYNTKNRRLSVTSLRNLFN